MKAPKYLAVQELDDDNSIILEANSIQELNIKIKSYAELKFNK